MTSPVVSGTLAALPSTEVAVPLPIRFDDDAEIRCPHCDDVLRELVATELDIALGVAFIVSCPSCRRVLSTTHRKGYLMG